MRLGRRGKIIGAIIGVAVAIAAGVGFLRPSKTERELMAQRTASVRELQE